MATSQLVNGTAQEPLHINTPLLYSRPLHSLTGIPIYLKLENCQPTASFKIRGIGHKIQQVYNSGSRHVVSSSGGNAGLACAYAASQLNIASTIFVPETTPSTTRNRLRDIGSSVYVHGKSWDDADAAAQEFCKTTGHTYIHPFDDPVVWEGHTSIISETYAQLKGKKPSCFVIAVGGGGLLAGVVEGLKKIPEWQDVPVVAMETIGADSYNSAIRAKKLITLPAITSLAICLGARTVSQKVLDYVVKDKHPITSLVVEDREAVDSCHRFVDDGRHLVELACGAALAAVYNGSLQKLQSEGKISNEGPAVVIVCGGANVTQEGLLNWRKKVGLI